ncbi:diguanylate cyclase (GGDEF)-like protein [Kutzneria viridogrisea]|uniref:Diguanylate cyclase (GGDEF)-like protein n=1 Tax=Kutzneria viridogrisea TaxID=47990 RepID=A0ABR6BWH0_9PSEU|nr:diguanylate cyclase (GGDEF)-like protein [Kutzneria viridogrisea]
MRLLLHAGRVADANTLFDQVISRAPVGDRWSRSYVLVFRATMAWRLRRIPLALELAAEGWTDLDSERPKGVAAARTISMLGYLLEGIGHRRAALDMIRLAVHVAREAGDLPTLAQSLQRLGGTLNFRAVDGSPVNADEIFGESRQHLEEGLSLVGPEDPSYWALRGAYSRALAGTGDLAQAQAHATEVLRSGRQREDLWSTSVGNWVLAAVHRQQGDLVTARTLGSRAVREAEEINDTSLLLRFSLDLAAICAELADPVGEAAALRRSVKASRVAAETLQEGLGQALEQRRLAVQAQRLAMAAQEAAARDPLTGLANRLGLERSAPRLLEGTAAKGRVPWLVLVDVDWFKDVNDDAGHAAGDAALREIARLLRRECRSEDLVARWAGDEFVVLLGDASASDVGPAVAERIRAAVDQHEWTMVLGTARRPTVSIGVAAGPAKLDQLFAAADIALYRAKRQGRNRVEVHDTAATSRRDGQHAELG